MSLLRSLSDKDHKLKLHIVTDLEAASLTASILICMLIG